MTKFSVEEMFSKIYMSLQYCLFQAHSSSGEFPSITLSACDDDDDDEDDDDLFTIQRDTVLDVGEVTMIFDDGNYDKDDDNNDLLANQETLLILKREKG